jgi:hypothetical protein
MRAKAVPVKEIAARYVHQLGAFEVAVPAAGSLGKYRSHCNHAKWLGDVSTDASSDASVGDGAHADWLDAEEIRSGQRSGGPNEANHRPVERPKVARASSAAVRA